jgi:HNH endonuclease
VRPGVLEDLVELCVQLAGHGGCVRSAQSGGTPRDRAQTGKPGLGLAGTGAAPLTAHAREMLERAIIGKAADLLSGPGGLASFLRRRQLGARLAGPSLPLDIGYSDTVPAGIRHAVLLRDRHCRWPGGCAQPAAACEVHHVRHKADGGPTSVNDCILLCWYHHQVVIHRWAWTLVLHPDGTTTARSPDGSKTLHSHGPPAAPRRASPSDPK